MTVPRETQDRLDIYGRMLRHWNERINLVSRTDLTDFQTRHLGDCVQLSALSPVGVHLWVDLGSGGGLPGIVIAISQAGTTTRFVLVESDKRKAAFLRQVVRETGLNNTTVLAERIETADPQEADIVSARALAPLPRLMPYLHRHLAATGRALLLKGRQWQTEVEDARRDWNFDCLAHPSITQDGAAILDISGVSHATI